VTPRYVVLHQLREGEHGPATQVGCVLDRLVCYREVAYCVGTRWYRPLHCYMNAHERADRIAARLNRAHASWLAEHGYGMSP